MYNNTLEHQFALARQKHVMATIENNLREYAERNYVTPKCLAVEKTKDGIKISVEELPIEFREEVIEKTVQDVLQCIINDNAVDDMYNEIISQSQKAE